MYTCSVYLWCITVVGVSREVENLILENNELLATKLVNIFLVLFLKLFVLASVYWLATKVAAIESSIDLSCRGQTHRWTDG